MSAPIPVELRPHQPPERMKLYPPARGFWGTVNVLRADIAAYPHTIEEYHDPEDLASAVEYVRADLLLAAERERDAVKADNEDGGVGALSVVWVNEDWQDEFASWYQPEQWMGQHRAVSAFLSRKVREMQTELAALRREREAK